MKLNGPFAPRPIAMLKSPAMRVLSLTGRRILDRLEIEHAAHGGRDNGKLPVTHRDFREIGINHDMVAAGIREVCALGLVEITEQGRGGNADYRKPNLFRLTYLAANGTGPTDEWRRIEGKEKAGAVAAKARAAVATEYRRSPGKTKSQSGKPGLDQSGKPGLKPSPTYQD